MASSMDGPRKDKRVLKMAIFPKDLDPASLIGLLTALGV